jgi:HEAT repeat protein
MDQASSHKNSPKTDNHSKAEHFLSSFIKAKNDLRIYPPSNPVVSESLDEALLSLKENFKSEMVEIAVEKDRLLINHERIGATDPRVDKLSLSLYRRGVRKIAVDPGIRFDEMRLLLDALNMKAEDIAEAGGIISILQKRNITHAAVEGTADLMIMDGANLPVSDDAVPDLSEFEEVNDDSSMADTPEGFGRMFVRVGDGDVDGIKRLRKLLNNPEGLTEMLERCTVQLEKVDGDIDPAIRVQGMLDMLQTLGTAISSLPSVDERSDMMKSMAVSVLGLSADLRGELVNKGIMPNLTLKGIESGILSRFPVTELADVLLENFQISGGAATVMEGYLNSLALDRSDKDELTETLQYSLKQSGKLTPHVEAVLMEKIDRVNKSGGENKPYTAPDPQKARMDFKVPSIDGYSPESIMFQGDEKAELISSILNEFESPMVNEMAYTLLALLQHEKSPGNHAELVQRFIPCIDQSLERHDYERVSDMIGELKAERERKSNIFSALQLKPLDEAIEKYVGEKGIRSVLKAFKTMKRESKEFKTVTQYFSTLGLSAVTSLLHSLEDEKSRHVRLLTCQVLAEIGDIGIDAVAERLDHLQWYVVRNAVSILGQIGTADCVSHLQKALSHPEPRVQREALKSLASIKTEQAVELICECVNECDVEICKAALGWVAVIRSPQALPSLERLLANGFLWEADDEFVRLAIQALGAIPADEAIPLLEKLRKTRRLIFGRKKAALIRETAALSLNKRKRTR